MGRTRRGKQRTRGFTLIEIAIVIAVMGALFTVLLGVAGSLLAQQRAQTTRTRLASIDAALSAFVSVNKRLPCPADGRVSAAAGGEENSSGSATRTCTGDQQHGVVPWRALGLAATDVEDGWGGRFTYRVGPDLVHDKAMDFSNCDPAGGNTTPIATPPAPPYCNIDSATCNSSNFGSSNGCTSPATALQGEKKGVVVKNVAGAAIMDPRGSTGTTPDITCALASTGAAYVVISHGAEGGGAYNSEGTMLTSSVPAGTMEAKNFANLTYTHPTCSGASNSYVVDDSFNAIGTSHFDDVVSRPTVLTLANRAQLGPRAKI